MGVVRFSIRIVFFILLLLIAIVFLGLFWFWIKPKYKNIAIKYWAKSILTVCGVKVNFKGQRVMDESVMWVSNHVSWIDVFVLNAVRPTVFIAKSEVKSWPVLGKMTQAIGTIFIDRQRRQSMVETSKKISQAFSNNVCIGLFPEGTTSDGLDMLTLHSGLLVPAIRAKVKIQPIALVYYHHNQRSGHVGYIGEQSLVENLWVLLSSSNVSVDAHFLDSVTQAGEQSPYTRSELGEMIREKILAKLLA